MIGISQRHRHQAAKNIPCCSRIFTRALGTVLRRTTSNYSNRRFIPDTTKAATRIAVVGPLSSPESKSHFTSLIFKRNSKLELPKRTMATATYIKVSTSDTGILGLSQNAESAKKASETLQADMERYHVFFNNAKGFHSMYSVRLFEFADRIFS